MPEAAFSEATVDVPPGSSLYVFSDGVFEIVDKDGRQWSIADFERLILEPQVNELGEPQRLLQGVHEAATPGPLDDDFSLVVAQFD